MKKPNSIRPRIRPNEEGYILVVVVFMLAVLMIGLMVAVPLIKKEIQRDRDVETMHRGKQYVRAVKLYYAQFGAYPPSIDALINTNQVRFLRKKYIDPTTGKADWKIIHVGENKTQTMGFFGQPIGGGAVGGTGPGSNGPNPSAGMPNSPGGGNSIFGSTDSGATPPAAAGSSTDPSAGTGASGVGAGTAGAAGTDPNAPNGGAAAAGAGTGLGGQTFGGAGMIGVSPASTKQSILILKKKNHYNDWEFFYDPLADQMMMQGGNAGAIGQPAAGMTTPVGGAATPFGSTTTPPATSPGAPPVSPPMAPAPQP